ncbi:MAG: sulfotransferase [Desulfobacterales bacterium]|nr:sulfotransferase [Desulfobacterales bacterium]
MGKIKSYVKQESVSANLRPVFIIGCPRTGSKMCMYVLNQCSNIDIMHEIHFLDPPWLHKDFVCTVKKEVGDLRKDSNIAKLIDLMYSGKLFGAFWKRIDLNKKKLENAIMNSDRSFRAIFEVLLKEHALSRGKTIPGAKFPVHFSYLPIILEWFPECKVIHLIRDPRAIYSSQVKARAKDRNSLPQNILIRLKMLVYVNIIYRWAVRIHKRFEHLDNYYLSRYEDIVAEPGKYVKKLCEFLEIDFQEEMLWPPLINSSYVIRDQTKGFDKEAINRWMQYTSSFSAKLICILNYKTMKEMGYLYRF